MVHYKKLLYHLEHNILPVQAFKAYRGSEIIQSSQLSILEPVQTLWESRHMKLEIRMWLADYMHTTPPLSMYTKSYIHTRLLYGKASMSILYYKKNMYSNYKLSTLTDCFTIKPYNEFVLSPLGDYTVGLFLYENCDYYT